MLLNCTLSNWVTIQKNAVLSATPKTHFKNLNAKQPIKMRPKRKSHCNEPVFVEWRLTDTTFLHSGLILAQTSHCLLDLYKGGQESCSSYQVSTQHSSQSLSSAHQKCNLQREPAKNLLHDLPGLRQRWKEPQVSQSGQEGVFPQLGAEEQAEKCQHSQPPHSRPHWHTPMEQTLPHLPQFQLLQ